MAAYRLKSYNEKVESIITILMSKQQNKTKQNKTQTALSSFKT